MRIGSLFSGGCGGLELGLERVGVGHVVWQCEIDAAARRNLARHWPGVKQYTDVREVHSQAYLDARVREWFTPFCGSDYTAEESDMVGKLKKLTKAQAEECVKMYRAGLSLAPIAEYFGVSRQAMWDLLRRRTAIRPQLRYGKENHFFRGGITSDGVAHNLVETALSQGVLVRPGECGECGQRDSLMADGRSRLCAHHDDYNKPLDVRWLCQKCHHAWHKAHKAIKKEVLVEAPAVDVICGGFP